MLLDETRTMRAPGGQKLMGTIETTDERMLAAMTFAMEWPDLALRCRLQAILNGTYRAAEDDYFRTIGAAEMPAICGMVSLSGARGEPLACGFARFHGGPHAWASLPTFAPGEMR